MTATLRVLPVTLPYAACVLLLFALPPRLNAQSVTGIVLDAQTGEPVDGAFAVLVDRSDTSHAATTTNVRGEFALVPPRPGVYFVQVFGAGYQDVQLGPIDVPATGLTVSPITLAPLPMQLDTLAVNVEARSPALERSGFYMRQAIGLGRHIDREEIERRSTVFTTDLLRMIPGVRLVPVGTSYAVVLRGGTDRSLRTRACLPQVFVDGVLMLEFELDRDIHPHQIEGIEVYRSASEVPAQYGGSQAACGVILIWTRR